MPTSYAVLDSGILLASVQSETYTEHAKALVARLAREQAQIIAPTLLRYELVARWTFCSAFPSSPSLMKRFCAAPTNWQPS
jgi:hypothetical protein